MKKALNRALMTAFAMAGLLLLMGATGSVDYAMVTGAEAPSDWLTAARVAGALLSFLASYAFFRGGEA